MPLPNPGQNYTPFDALPAASLNDMVENIEALADGTGFETSASISSSLLSNSCKFRTYRNTAYNTANGVWTKMPYDTENYDTGSNVSSGTFTAPIAGVYDFKARWGSGSSTANFSSIALYKNGTEVSRGSYLQYVGAPMGNVVNDQLQLAANDTIEVWYISNGVMVADVGSAFNYFSGRFVSK